MRKALLFLCIVIINVSCLKDVDFKQTDTAMFSTPMSVALLYLDLHQDDFLDNNNNELSSVNKLFIIDLSEFFYESDTNSLDFVTKFFNSFNREFSCQFEFIDNDDNILLRTETFLVFPTNLEVEQSLTFELDEFDRFLEARWINVRISLRNGEVITPSNTDNLEIQSVIHFDYEIAP